MTRKFILNVLGVVFAALFLVSLIFAQTPDRYRPRVEPLGLSQKKQGKPSDGRSFRRDLRQSAPTMAADSDPLLLPVVTYPSGAIAAGLVSVVDVNADGKPDIVVLNYCGGHYPDGGCTPGKVGVLLGNGDGTFQPVVTYSTGGHSSFGMKVADMNADGKPDFVVASTCGTDRACLSATITILLGNGDGTFQPAIVSDAGGNLARDLAVADFNGDGKLDVATVHCDASGNCWIGTGQVAVLLGNGDGTLHKAVLLPLGGQTPQSIATADVNGDGQADVVVTSCGVANPNENTCDNLNTYDVLLGKGNGTFRAPITSTFAGFNLRSLTLADVNGDGRPDMFISAEGVDVLLGNGDGTFRVPVFYSSCFADAITIADLDRDGKPDLLLSTPSTQDCTVHRGAVDAMKGNGDGTFQPIVSYDSGGVDPGGTAAADVNGDGKPDVVVADLCLLETNCDAGGLVGVLLNNSPPHSPTTTTLVPSANPIGLRKPVTYTATVSSGYTGPVRGTITYRDGGTILQTMPMLGTPTSYTTSYNKVGSHSITAAFSGDADSAPSTSLVLTEYVAGPSQMTLTSSGSPSHVGQSVTFTVTLASKYGSPADGELVTFSEGKKILGSAPMARSVAVFTISTFTAKKHTIKATYGGNTGLLPCHRSIVQVVEP